jgi:hypothetical protein
MISQKFLDSLVGLELSDAAELIHNNRYEVEIYSVGDIIPAIAKSNMVLLFCKKVNRCKRVIQTCPGDPLELVN